MFSYWIRSPLLQNCIIWHINIICFQKNLCRYISKRGERGHLFAFQSILYFRPVIVYSLKVWTKNNIEIDQGIFYHVKLITSYFIIYYDLSKEILPINFDLSPAKKKILHVCVRYSLCKTISISNINSKFHTMQYGFSESLY